MSNPEAKIHALKSLIQNHLNSTGITDKIEKALKEQDRDQVIQSISRENVVDKVLTELKNVSLEEAVETREEPTEAVKNADQLPSGILEGGKRFLQVTITQGRAFLDDLENNEGASFKIHALCLGRRVASKAVPAMCDPPFDETFYFCLDSVEKRGGLVTCQSKLLLTLVRTSHTGQNQLLGSCAIDWRKTLDKADVLVLNQEVAGTKSDCGVSVGLLTIRLKIIPSLQKKISPDLLKSQLSLEHDRNVERDRLFLMYSKQWWNEYLSLRPAHADRLVKIFTEDEGGSTHMVCMMLAPLRSHLVESPRQAARFVSQIPCCQKCLPGSNTATEQWLSPQSFIAVTNGDIENHCLLLCSLLLGFGLDSYVCIGSKSKGSSHMWVMTLTESIPTFWDAITGQRYVSGDTLPYRTIDCIFNHKSFLGNAQPSNSITKTKFDLCNPVLWKAVSEDAIQSMRASMDQHNMTITLNPSVIDPYHTASNLEHQIKRLVRDEREKHDLSTHWNEDLAHLLLPALSAYELERASGVTVSNEDFQQAVRHAVPDGFTFKGYPAQFNHLNFRQIFRECMRSEVCSDLITCHGDGLQFALKIRIYPYPEDVVACWIMFACQYRCIL